MKSTHRILLCSLAVTALVGCCPPKRPDAPVPAIDTKKKVEIDPRLLMECPPLSKLESGKDVDILESNKAWFKDYQACRDNKSKLNSVVKDAFNLKDTLPK